MSRPRHRTVLAAVLAGIVLAAIANNHVAGAAGGRARSYRVEYTTQRNDLVSAPVCDAEGDCLFPYTAPSEQWTGDFVGGGPTAGSAALGGAEGGFGLELKFFTGTIEPCGTGSLVVRASGINEPTHSGTGTWEIVEGFGTGDLVDVTGGGTSEHQSTEDLLSVTTTAKGKVRC